MRQRVHGIGQRCVLAGAEPENMFFYKTAGYQIAYPGGGSKKQEPEGAALAEIDQGKDQQEQVKRYPQVGLPHENEKGIAEAVASADVYKVKYFPVQWLYMPEPGDGGL